MKLVRALVAAAASITAALAFQLATPSAGATSAADSTDCAVCWPPGIIHR